jgi:hypothetical protein
MCGSRGPRTRNGVRNVDVHSNNEVNPVILAKAICRHCNKPRDFREMVLVGDHYRCLFCLEEERIRLPLVWLVPPDPANPA